MPHQPRPTDGKPGAKERELRDEQAERRQADDGQHARREQSSGPRHGLEQARDADDFRGPVALQHAAGEEERHRLRQRVVEHVQHRGEGPQRAERQPHANQPGVLDARVRQHPLVVALNDETERPDAQREQPHRDEQIACEAGADRGIHDGFPPDYGVQRDGKQDARHHRG